MWNGAKNQVKIILIRHGQTVGNLNKRYIGSTDEPLCSDGIKMLKDSVKDNKYPNIEKIYVSPMKRCIETAEIIYPGNKYIKCENLRECDFGEFENKNYIELSSNENYKKWLYSNGTMPFPSGEKNEDFKMRCIKGYENIIDNCESDAIAFIVHGGTIMSILDHYSRPNKSFYYWQIKNGEGYICELSEDRIGLIVISKITGVGEKT